MNAQAKAPENEESFRVAINPATGMRGYAFADGFQLMEGGPYPEISKSDYDERRKTTVERGGTKVPVISKL